MKLLSVFLLTCLAAAALARNVSPFESSLEENVFAKRDLSQLFDGEHMVTKVGGFIRERLQSFLQKIKDVLAQHKDIFDALNQKIERLQEQVKNLVYVAGERLWQTAEMVRTKIVELAQTVLDRISAKGEYALLPSFEELGDFLSHVVGRVRKHFQQLLEKVKSKIAEHQDVFDAVKEKIAAIQERIRELGQQAGSALIQKASELQARLTELLQTVLQKIQGKLEVQVGYSLYEQEKLGFFEELAQRIGERLQNVLSGIMDRVAKFKDIAADIKDKVLAIKEKLQEIPKASGLKLVELARKLQQQLKELLQVTMDKIKNKETQEVVDTEYSLFGIDESSQKGTLFGRITERLSEKFQALIENIKQRLAKHNDIFEAVKEKIASVQAKIRELAESAGAKLIEKARQVRTQLGELLKNVLDRLQNKEEKAIGYALYEDASEGGFLENIAQRVRARLESVLAAVLERVEKYKDIANDIKDKVLLIKDKLAEIPKAGGLKLVEIAHSLQGQLKELLKSVVDKIAQKETAEYSAYAETDGPGEGSRRRLQTHLDELKTRVAKYNDVQQKFGAQLEALQSRVDAVSELRGFELMKTSSQLLREIGALRTKALQIIGIRRPDSY